MVRRLIFILIIAVSTLFGEQNNTAIVDGAYLKQINEIREKINKEYKSDALNNEWTKTYSSYIQQKELLDRKKEIEKRIKKLKRLKSLTPIQKSRLKKLHDDLKLVEDKIKLVENFEDDPFKKLIEPPKIDEAPKITNPIALIGGFSYLKELQSKKSKYEQKYQTLNKTLESLKKIKLNLAKIVLLENGTNSIDKMHLQQIKDEIKHLSKIKDIYKTTKDIFDKKVEENIIAVKKDINQEIKKLMHIGIIALILLMIFIFSKLLTRKYLAQKDSYYVVNKTLNILFITILAFAILFEYLENVSYLITILGFASAGIAIAMKDWFMSLMGWFVIVLGGAIHVGDRIKVVRGNTEYVGDVIDISLLRITLQEDITLTTYMHNRRAGRIIFVPNNYIFTDMIANYSHAGLKTVWDGIDFYITFDSNVNKAMNIAKNIAKKYSKGYTDITRKQLNRLRSKYQLKNANVEPRVFSFIEGYGMKVSVWYLTNSYATLTLRTTISTKIIEEINRCDDIVIAYPTQNIYHESNINKPKIESKEIEDSFNV